ncbi:MAG: hypothetical protein IJD22_08095 [Clostridia bacterium]|nr:hypothetical protein [Clostridia bacterium]
MKDLGNVMILGDSYSTFEGYIPEGYEAWYSPAGRDCNNVCRVEECWWHQFFSEAPARLAFNCSYSGTTICNTGYEGADCREISFIGRLDKLIDNGYFKKSQTDTLFIFGATNDSWAGSPLGEQKLCDWSADDLYSVFPAFSYMLSRAKEALPKARIIYIMNFCLNPEFAPRFEESCLHFGVEFLPLTEFQLGGGHPTVLGMKQIKEQITAYLEDEKNEK